MRSSLLIRRILNPECICDVINSLQQEEANERRKQNRLKEVNKKRNLESLQKDAMKRGKEFEKKVIKLCVIYMYYML